ncbi:hypothetical protein FA09DRAFT_291744, partial [Tilletiopsis washingtonensis]
WWLDINCPTYLDMTELSKMFPLHPLTVEDVLQQEPREKVETFDALGYYFVIVEGLDGKAGLEGVSVGGTNLYMIVFKHGLITFHFEDVSKHTDRVRRRLLDSTHPAELSSDWIAHGLYDSAVDAFFPLLAFIEVEVAEIELVTAFLSDNAQGQSKLLRRITDARKLVTGLSRLLAPKNDAVRGLRKRLVELRGTGAGASEMSIYMGDVLDHIVTLLAHLAESDARLHQTHHTYLSAISLNNQQVAHSTDEILIVLATITVAIFGMQCVLGLGSMNVEVPHNLHAEDRPPGEPPRYWWFIGIV